MSDLQTIETAESLDNAAEATETQEELKNRLEAEIRAEYEKMIDKRVSQAVKTVQKKREKAEAIERAEAEAIEKAQAEKRAEALAAQDRRIRKKANRLTLVDVIAENTDVPGAFIKLIPVDDLIDIDNEVLVYEILRNRVRNTYYEFTELVKKEVKKQRELYKR